MIRMIQKSRRMLLKRESGNRVWGIGYGESGMGNGEWGMGNGEWGMRNSGQRYYLKK